MFRDGSASSDHLRVRAEESRLKLWFLLDADRGFVTGVLLLVVFATLTAAGFLVPGAEGAIRTGDSVDTLFQALLTATITGVTLVLTLNQLVLSQEFGAAGDQRERMEEATRFREDVADAVGAPVSPARPAQFLRALVQVAGERAADLRDAAGDGEGEPGPAVASLADDVIRNAEAVAEGLDGAQFGEFDVVASALEFNYSRKVFAARRLRERHGDALDGEATEALDGLIEVLRLFGPAREHFKTLYFQRELIALSQRIVAASVPALLVSAVVVAYFDAATYGAGTLVVVVAAAVTVALSPFLILLSYVARIATVTKHTLSIGPFVLRETDDVAEVEWGE